MATETKTITHTPGRWEYVIHDDGETSSIEIEIRMGSRLGGRNGWEPQHRIDYRVPAWDESPEQYAEAEANARLIAAAPDLLAALKAIVTDHPETGFMNLTVDNARAAHAAILKAEGSR